MSDAVYLIDVTRGDDSRRFVGESIADILMLLKSPDVQAGLTYLRVEKLQHVTVRVA